MHYIFLVHGMGNSSTGWSEEATKIIKRHYDKDNYQFLSRCWPFEAHFKVEELVFNNFFDQYLAEAEAQAKKLAQWNKLHGELAGGLLNIIKGFLKVASVSPNRKNFVVSHLLDVALFMATNLGELARSSLASEIVNRLNAAQFDPAKDSWSVVAHSLGTRVMAEALQIGFTAQPSMRNFGKAQVLMMVANVTNLLHRLPPSNVLVDPYRNQVFPSNDVGGVCRHFINASHRLDPFAFIREFDPPPDFGDGYAFVENTYHPVKLAAADITAVNVHALEHYLENPKVHLPLFRYLVSPDGAYGPTDAEMQAAMEIYRINTVGAELDDAWRKALTDLKDLPSGKLEEIFDIWEKYGALLK